MKRSFVILAAIAAAFAGNALAQNKSGAPLTEEQKDARWEENFKKADTDHSGGLNKAELAKTRSGAFPGIKKHFDAMDANKDGQVTVGERDAYIASHQARKTAAKKR